MSEREIIETIFEIYDRDWSMIQWWGTISFGLIAVAQFEIGKLNAWLLALLVCLYTLFTGWIGFIYIFNIQMLAAFNKDLEALGDAMQQGSQALLRSRLVYNGVALEYVAVLMTYFASIGYLIYSYRSNK